MQFIDPEKIMSEVSILAGKMAGGISRELNLSRDDCLKAFTGLFLDTVLTATKEPREGREPLDQDTAIGALALAVDQLSSYCDNLLVIRCTSSNTEKKESIKKSLIGALKREVFVDFFYREALGILSRASLLDAPGNKEAYDEFFDTKIDLVTLPKQKQKDEHDLYMKVLYSKMTENGSYNELRDQLEGLNLKMKQEKNQTKPIFTEDPYTGLISKSTIQKANQKMIDKGKKNPGWSKFK